ncbi:MAG: asparagine synthase (glutamine-hydrolyzing) [Candidatus Brocadiaceae bacterium]|nr:asparagine synthase (glutamine-hydrolyzing) [Candidatus Brocadiaceae bacterium]
MCGICGVIGFDEKRPVGAENIQPLLEEMCQALYHRGPDEGGMFIEGDVGLGMRRLSIIDLETGHQPIHNEDKTIWVVHNGEIYNYKELRPELISKGHKFYTSSDTEVIVHAYEEYGEGCLQRLRGMFAFALWDKKEKRLLAARDRLGMKPLLYTLADEKLLFASELKALLRCKEVYREVDPLALRNFLRLGYIPSPQAIFSNVKKLPPATYLIYKGGEVSERRYWALPSPEAQLRISEEEASQRLVGHLGEAVELHLRSDVPVGVFLSGGLDSTGLVSLAIEKGQRPLKTFFVGFKDAQLDESSYARLVAQRYGTQHREVFLEPKDVVELLPRILWHLDEPFGDAAVVPTFLVSQLASQEVKVCLSGEGGDELFAGYSWYPTSNIRRWYGSLPAVVRHTAYSLVQGLGPARRDGGFVEDIKSLIGFDFLPPRERYLWRRAHFSPEELNTLLDPKYFQNNGKEKEDVVPEITGSGDMLSDMLYYDTQFFLPDDLLTKVDCMGMAHGLETRLPLLDHPLVEFAYALPSSLKMRDNTSKYLYKKAIGSLIPKEVLNRGKLGLMPPLTSWLKGELRGFCREILLDNRTRRRAWFNHKAVEELLVRYEQAESRLAYKLWDIIVLEIWARVFIDGEGP